MNPELNIFVVSYKRPQVLDMTLTHLFAYMTKPQFFSKVRLAIAINETTPEYERVIQKWYYDYNTTNNIPHLNDFHVVYYENNMGKAHALNMMFSLFAQPKSFTVTMDDDMVFTDTYMEVFEEAAQHLRFELIGFASNQFWGHHPLKENAMYLDWRKGYKVWHTMSIAGGLMMGSYDFLFNNEWTNVDGIYGGDDFNMCYLTNQKFIIEDERDWLVHDPFGPNLPELERYYAAKNYYRQQGLFIYPKGWYEDAPIDGEQTNG